MLVVEDDPDTQEAVVAMLEELGHPTAAVVANGVEAIEHLKQCPSALMMLDLMMPLMDGFELLRELRAGNAPRPGKIIVMSAHASPSEREGIYALGADHFLSKPFTLDELKQAIDTVA